MQRNPAQVAFYHSQQWRKARAAYLDARHHICERCGRAASIVHHKRYITPANVGDPSITLDPSNLEALCIDCHNAEHFGTGSTAPGLTFDGDGNLIAAT